MVRTLVSKVDADNPNKHIIEKAADLITRGRLVAFPTETVYGLGVDALNSDAVRAAFEAKRRPLDNPPIVHVSAIEDIQQLVRKVPNNAHSLMRAFWPGPLTLILERSSNVPSVTVSGLKTIAIRMPCHKVALALIQKSCRPIAAPSANLSGKPSPTSAIHVFNDLNGQVDMILDSGPTLVGIESTVLDLTICPPEILRPGAVTREMLESVIGKVIVHRAAIASEPAEEREIRSPGMMHRHYAPDAEMVLVEGDPTNVIAHIKLLTGLYRSQNKRVGVLGSDETMNQYKADSVKSMGCRRDLGAVARSLFRLLREFDSEKIDVIISEGVNSESLGLAIMNRLRKASGYRIIRV